MDSRKNNGITIVMTKAPNGVILRPIPESPNADYMAGEDGQVYSRTRYAGFGRKERTDWYALTGHMTEKGYRSISMCHQGKKVTKSVHRLICSAFHGPAPEKSSQARHLDGNPENNLPANLRWGSQYENWQDRKAHGRGVEGEKHHAAKLTDQERASLRWAVTIGLCSGRHAAQVLNMSQSAVAAIVSG